MDRADSFGAYGPLFIELCGVALHLQERPLMINKIYGLGGRDFMPEHAELVLNELVEISKTGKVKIFKEYIGVRE